MSPNPVRRIHGNGTSGSEDLPLSSTQDYKRRHDKAFHFPSCVALRFLKPMKYSSKFGSRVDVEPVLDRGLEVR
jgi:hypothetical protein